MTDVPTLYSWSESDATTTSATLSCPGIRGLRCGFTIEDYMIRTTGEVCTERISGHCTDDSDGCNGFEVEAPELAEDCPNDDSDACARAVFSACIFECDGDACDRAEEAGLSRC